MKANELMIGDIVTFQSSLDEAAIPIRVEIVGIGYQDKGEENECLVRIDNDEACDIIDIEDEVVGIPITPEILEKNGFEKREVRILAGSKTHYCIVDDYFELAINEYTDSIWEVEYTNIEAHFPLIRNLVGYVHELQHALRLCGIDKEIEL